MNALNTFRAKVGPGGKRNRRAARRAEERAQGPGNVRLVHAARERLNKDIQAAKDRLNKGIGTIVHEQIQEAFRGVDRKPVVTLKQALEPKINHHDAEAKPASHQAPSLAGDWTPSLARYALQLHADSGLSGRAFAALHNFPENRLRAWRKRLEA